MPLGAIPAARIAIVRQTPPNRILAFMALLPGSCREPDLPVTVGEHLIVSDRQPSTITISPASLYGTRNYNLVTEFAHADRQGPVVQSAPAAVMFRLPFPTPPTPQ